MTSTPRCERMRCSSSLFAPDRSTFHEWKPSRLVVEIADDLIAFPIVTVAAAHLRHGRSNEANRNAITQLVDLGVLEPYGEARYARFFWSKRVFSVIDAGPL
jgi:hypothetical protein